MRKYRKYTDQDIINSSFLVKSMAGLLRELNLRPTGGNYDNMKRNLQRLSLTCDHWTGQLWHKNEQLKDWSQYAIAANFKPHLIKKKGHKCEDCGNVKWKDKLIALEIHHLDGDRTNNKYENLQLLCPNCHAFTGTWKNKTRRNSPTAGGN